MSKIVTVDVKGNAPLWLKIKDLVDGVTYNFRICAKTFTYGPEVEANITTGPGEGLYLCIFTLSHITSAFTLSYAVRTKLYVCNSIFLTVQYTGAPGPPGEPFISRYGSALTIHWTSGDPGRAPISRYVIEARPSGRTWSVAS